MRVRGIRCAVACVIAHCEDDLVIELQRNKNFTKSELQRRFQKVCDKNKLRTKKGEKFKITLDHISSLTEYKGFFYDNKNQAVIRTSLLNFLDAQKKIYINQKHITSCFCEIPDDIEHDNEQPDYPSAVKLTDNSQLNEFHQVVRYVELLSHVSKIEGFNRFIHLIKDPDFKKILNLISDPDFKELSQLWITFEGNVIPKIEKYMQLIELAGSVEKLEAILLKCA